MNILIVSATEKEILPLKNKLNSTNKSACGIENKDVEFNVDFLVTGIGGAFTIYSLMKKMIDKTYDVFINAGIAGSFNQDIAIGDVVFVQADQFADLGIEDSTGFSTLFEKGFMDKNEFPFTESILSNPYDFETGLRKVSGITVNMTHGCNNSIDLYKKKFNADIETMEGAAFFYLCLKEGVKFMQIRAISNYVKIREESTWDIPLAVRNLNDKLFEIIEQLDMENSSWDSY